MRSRQRALRYLDTLKVAYSTYASVRDGLDAVKTGQIDAFVHDQPILAWLAKKEFGSGIEVLETVFDKQNYAIALPNGSPLRAKINLVLVPATGACGGRSGTKSISGRPINRWSPSIFWPWIGEIMRACGDRPPRSGASPPPWGHAVKL